MKTNGFNSPVTPAKIVGDNWCFSIPIYQRLFVWESEQIDRLLDDLWAASASSSPYHIGVITIVEGNDEKRGRVFSVVDGQQRLTFLLLFFCELLSRNECPEMAKRFVFLDRATQTSKELRIRFLGRTDDEDDIQNYATIAGAKKWDEIKNLNFRQFHFRMESFIKKHKDSWEFQKDLFIEYVFNQTSFLMNELVGYSNADLNLYFEKMNSTGRQLSPLDQLKGYFAEYASDWNDCFNFEKARIETKTEKSKGTDTALPPETKIDIRVIVDWNTEVEKEPPQNQDSNLFSRLPMRPEVFALQTLRLAVGKEKEKGIDLSPRHLLDSFKSVLDSKELQDSFKRKEFLGHFVEELKTYRDWIDNNIIYLRGEVEGDDGEESDSSGLRYAFRGMQLQDNEERFRLNKKMLQLQSMLYVSSGVSQDWILDAYTELKGNQLSFEALREIAMSRLEKVRKNVDELFYNPGMDRLPFWMLDYLLWERVYDAKQQGRVFNVSLCDEVKLELSKEQMDAIANYRFTQNRSVEHLHPQNPPEESEAWKEDRKKGDVIRNSFGNLCMIAQGANSSLGNDPVDFKFAKVRYALQGHPLQSIKLLLMFADCGGQDSEWTPEQAIKHGCEMLQLLGFDASTIEDWKRCLETGPKGE